YLIFCATTNTCSSAANIGVNRFACGLLCEYGTSDITHRNDSKRYRNQSSYNLNTTCV
ncbi:hypothetical protein L9F63_001586, partial [Diploptera punctata]